MTPPSAASAVNRFGLGARPGDLQEAASDPQGWLRAQLQDDPGVPERFARLPSSLDYLRRENDFRGERLAERRRRKRSEDPASSGEAADGDPVQRFVASFRETFGDEILAELDARYAEAITSAAGFRERLVHFWSNHFAVSIDKLAVLGLAGSFEREAIRPHVLGRFEELLLAVERHPAMLLYLDNQRSIGPNSRAAAFVTRRRPDRAPGLNENLAREILELHTLGVDGGYTQADVTAFAQVITGWSIGGGRARAARGEPGRFTFRPEIHEPGAKTILGKRYAEDGEREGVAVLHDLAHHPATARHIATKLARHFIADEPPTAVVDRQATAWARSDGDLPSVYRALLDSPEAWASPLPKFRTPADYVHAAYRALELPVESDLRALAPFELLGQRTFSPGSPAGWPDRSADWDGSSAVMKRIAWADVVGRRLGDRRNATNLAAQILGGTLSESTRTATARAASGAQALTLLLASPEFMRR